jgi:hypothetical protein
VSQKVDEARAEVTRGDVLRLEMVMAQLQDKFRAKMKSVGSNERDPSNKRRTTSALIAGKGKTLADIVSPIVDEQMDIDRA